MQITILLLIFGIWGSSLVWWQVFNRLRLNQPVLEQVEGPIPDWRSVPEITAVLITLAYIGLALFASTQSHDNREPITLLIVALQIAVSLALVLFLLLIILAAGHPLSLYGVRLLPASEQLKQGFHGFLAALLPMALSMIATLPFRSRETEHSFLKMIGASPDVRTVGMVAVAAVIAAPLWEELQFRVIMQGWLSTRIPRRFAIGIVAGSFSLVHGWRDGLALIPLALILGYVFDRRRSYLTVVVIHALFNATMMTLGLLNPENP